MAAYIEVEFFDVTVVNGGSYPIYSGPYAVTPHCMEQTLATQNKAMSDDVTVHTIPSVSAINPGGGYTVTIG